MSSSWPAPKEGSRLHLRIGAAFALLALVVFSAVGWLSGQQARRQVVADADGALMQVAGRLAASLDTDMFERAREIRNLAELDTLLDTQADPSRWRTVLEKLQQTYPDYAWLGFADASGIVRSATGGVLEGQSVAQRPWFAAGLNGPFVGDVHDAVMLAQALGHKPGAEPLRLVDIAAPVVREGRRVGVLGSHLSWRWADERRRLILEPLHAQQVEAIVLGREGELLLNFAGSVSTLPREALQRLASRGPAIETWSDGRAYLSAAVRADGHRTYPGLGWTIVVRQPIDAALAPAREIERRLWAFGLIGAAAFGVLAWWLARRLTAPLRALAEQARGLAPADAPIAHPAGQDEVAALAATLGELMRRLRQRTEELARLNQGLEHRVKQRTEALELANEDLQSFSRSVSHDLKGPLGSMASLLGLLADREGNRLDGDSRRMLDAVGTECDRLRGLIDELMVLARVEQKPLEWDTVSMDELARFVVDGLRRDGPQAANGAAPRRAAELVVGSLPIVHGDPVLLHQVWQNLLSNAVKFSGRAEAPRIEIGAETTEHEIVYRVSDNGSGFDMAQGNRLFGVFQRLHHEADFPGHGVGLSIVKRIVHRHGGRVWAHSVPGERTSFFFALPRVPRPGIGSTAGAAG